MEEENEKVVEETTQETTEQVDESKFESAGDDSVIKVDLNKPPEPKQDEVKEDNADDSGVVAESEDADTTQEQELEAHVNNYSKGSLLCQLVRDACNDCITLDILKVK